MDDEAMTDEDRHRSLSIVHRPYQRCAAYELLSRLLSAPDIEHGRRAIQIAFALSDGEGLPEDVRARLKKLTASLARVGSNEIERAWQSTFGLTDGGALSLCETEYGMAHVFQKSNTLADIAGFYRAFGLERSDGSDRPDHLSVEFEFLSVLAAREARALSEGRSDRAEIAVEAERLFLSEHTGRFCVGLFKRILEGGGFYADVAEAGLVIFAWLLSEHGIELSDQMSPSGPKGPEEPMMCGGGPCPVADSNG